jgi:hypothetical protein
MNWHQELITPSLGAYLFLGLLTIGGLIWIVARVEAREAKPEPEDDMASPYGDIIAHPRALDGERS